MIQIEEVGQAGRPHPQVISIFEQMAEDDSQPLSDLTPAEARVSVAEMQGLAGDKVPVSRVEDQIIQSPDGEIPVRIYTRFLS
jgi:hypothetical protein